MDINDRYPLVADEHKSTPRRKTYVPEAYRSPNRQPPYRSTPHAMLPNDAPFPDPTRQVTPNTDRPCSAKYRIAALTLSQRQYPPARMITHHTKRLLTQKSFGSSPKVNSSFVTLIPHVRYPYSNRNSTADHLTTMLKLNLQYRDSRLITFLVKREKAEKRSYQNIMNLL